MKKSQIAKACRTHSGNDDWRGNAQNNIRVTPPTSVCVCVMVTLLNCCSRPLCGVCIDDAAAVMLQLEKVEAEGKMLPFTVNGNG